HARLVETVTVLCGVVVVSELLGAVGAFRRGPLVGACAASGVAVGLAARRHRPPGPAGSLPPVARSARWVAAAVVGVVVAQWAAHALGALDHGTSDYDSLHY